MSGARFYLRAADRDRIYVDLGGAALIGVSPTEVIRHAARRGARAAEGVGG